MNPRIASMENLIARDPGGRNVFGLVAADQLRLAAQALRFARRVAVVTGYFIPEAGAGETDGPPGAVALGEALGALGIPVDYLTDGPNAPLLRSLGAEPIVLEGAPEDVAAGCRRYLEESRPTHLVSVERAGRAADGTYRNMRGTDITTVTAPLDELFLEASQRGLTTIGVGDGGNEIGMGRVFAATRTGVPHGRALATTVATDFCVAAGVSNWGALGLVGALSVLEGRDLLPSGARLVEGLHRLVEVGGAVDGVTRRREPTVDGLPVAESLRVLAELRGHVAPPPFLSGRPLAVGVLGWGETGRAAAALLRRRGHRVRVSDHAAVCPPSEEDEILEGFEAGGHTVGFLAPCDAVVASPGVPVDAPIRAALHERGIPVVSALEMAYPFCPHPLVGVTGTVGKRTTVELIGRMFRQAGRPVAVGGNRGAPLAALLLGQDGRPPEPDTTLVLAVSSFQLEGVVHFRPPIAAMLNIDAAHLDRHRTVAEYVRVKSRIFMNHRPEDVLILNGEDPRLQPLASKHLGRTFFVGRRRTGDFGAWLERGAVRVNTEGVAERLGRAEHPYPEVLLTAVLAALLSGIPPDAAGAALHRLRTGGGSA
ncbi:MAG: glutamate cyclase domain-containing protein [Deferrisomatales bacterium]